MNQHRIVVIGAGYAGLLAALRLGGMARNLAQVTLINASDVFVERIRLHQVAAGQRVRPHALAPMVARRGIMFIQGMVTALSPQTRTLQVQMAGGSREIAYDTLVYALGSTIERDRVPGVRDHAYTLVPDGERGAEALASRLHQLPAGAAITVAGGGLTGIEAVTELAEAFPDLRFTLVTREGVGASVSADGRAYIRRVMARLGIQMREHTAITRVDADGAVLDTGQPLSHAALLWTGTFAVPTLARDAGIAVNSRNQLCVDAYNRSVSHSDIYAAGDCAAAVPVNGISVRMSCQSALPQGAYVATAITARLQGCEPEPFSMGFLMQCVSLGRRDALVQFVTAEDTPTRILTGRPGVIVKELVCRYTLIGLRLQRFISLYTWPKGRNLQRSAHTVPVR